jgi:hypothetical protein
VENLIKLSNSCGAHSSLVIVAFLQKVSGSYHKGKSFDKGRSVLYDAQNDARLFGHIFLLLKV